MTPVDGWDVEVATRMTEIGEHLGARPGHMFGHPALYAGRRLAVCAYGSGLGLKLPAARVRGLIETGQGVHFVPYGKALMREWILAPATMRDDVDGLTELIAEALEYARTGDT